MVSAHTSACDALAVAKTDVLEEWLPVGQRKHVQRERKGQPYRPAEDRRA